ncbi:MAG: hypothetical protein WBP81_17110 [Solirubrobacteraceae bacterium]
MDLAQLLSEFQDVLVLERGEPGEILVEDLAAAGAEVVDGVVDVLGVLKHEDVAVRLGTKRRREETGQERAPRLGRGARHFKLNCQLPAAAQL